MQLLEQLSVYGSEYVEEGLFGSSVPDSDYNKLLEMAQTICTKLKLPTDSKEYEKNRKVLELANKKTSSRITLRTIKGKCSKMLSTDINDVKSMSSLFANDIVSFIKSKYKLKNNGKWAISMTGTTEINRSIQLIGPIGESSFVYATIVVYDYNMADETAIITLVITNRTDKLMSKYDKL